MRRHEDWDQRLARFVLDRQTTAFSWGKNDCCLFVADGVAEMTGEDLAKGLRGKYRSELGAAKLIKKNRSLRTLISRKLGKPKPPLIACRGDIVLVETETGPGVGLCMGRHIALVSPRGITNLPLSKGIVAWAV